MPAQPKPADAAPADARSRGRPRVHGALDMVRPDRIGGWAIDRRDSAAPRSRSTSSARAAGRHAPRRPAAQGPRARRRRDRQPRLRPRARPAAGAGLRVHRHRQSPAPPTAQAPSCAAPAPAGADHDRGRLLERIFEEVIGRARTGATAAEASLELLQRLEVAQARIEAALAALEPRRRTSSRAQADPRRGAGDRRGLARPRDRLDVQS